MEHPSTTVPRLLPTIITLFSGVVVDGFDGATHVVPSPTVIREIVHLYSGGWVRDLSGIDVLASETMDRDHRPLGDDDDLPAGEYLIRLCNTKNEDILLYVQWDGQAVTGAWLDWKDCGENLLHLSAPE